MMLLAFSWELSPPTIGGLSLKVTLCRFVEQAHDELKSKDKSQDAQNNRDVRADDTSQCSREIGNSVYWK